MTNNRSVSEMVERADSIYARCSFWPERTEDGQIALLELRNLYHEAIRPVLAAIPSAVASDDEDAQWLRNICAQGISHEFSIGAVERLEQIARRLEAISNKGAKSR